MNAFMLFAKRHRSLVRSQFPNHANRMASKILSEWWYSFPADQKQLYYALADEIRSEHLRSHPGWSWRGAKRELNELSPSPLIEPSKRSIEWPKIDRNCLTLQSTLSAEAMPILKLAPTPAQLGRARKRPKPNLTIDTSTAALLPTLAPVATPNFTETREFQDKLDSLPGFDYVNHRSITLWPTFSAALNPDAKLMESYEPRPIQPTPNQIIPINRNSVVDASRNIGSGPSQPKKKLVGSVFFGPDFNPANFTNSRKFFLLL